ncbi:hypothetical protein FRC11_004224 [Ceratobasidium sp. 423]|nr:hypothetical protein FRC11_004224 [Ceratobasidium sp. 423]
MNISSRAKPATDLPMSYETVRQSISLQLHIELEVNGLEIPKQSPKVGTSYASILQELKDYRDAWLKFRLSPVVVQRIMGPDILCPHWEIQNGAYIGGFRESEEEYEDDFRFDRIQVSKFYSSTTPPPLHFKKFDHFVADVYQDLVALIDYDADRSVFARVYFYHTVTGQPHPLARLSTFTVRFEDYVDEEPVWGPLETDPMIMGSILVIKFTWPEGSHYYYDALIWNWRSGLLLGRIHSEANSADFTFLDKNHLLLYAFPSDSSIESNSERPSQVALLIYRVPTTAAVSHQELPNADFYAPSYPVLEPVLILELPKLNRIYQIPRAGEGYETRATITHFSIFANTNFILEFLTKNRLEETARMTWSQWGTAATRWFVDDDSPAANIASIEGSLHLRWNLDHHDGMHIKLAKSRRKEFSRAEGLPLAASSIRTI